MHQHYCYNSVFTVYWRFLQTLPSEVPQKDDMLLV